MHIDEASDGAGGARLVPDARARRPTTEGDDDQAQLPLALPSDAACATEEEERMLRFRRELRDEVGAAEDHPGDPRRAAGAPREELARAGSGA